jgi:mono/diheme cytochrome c family protein
MALARLGAAAATLALLAASLPARAADAPAPPASGAGTGPAAPPPVAASPPETPERLARGEDRMKDFCLACHVLEAGPGVTNPLRPRITPAKWGTYAQAYENIGQLNRIRPQMVHAFRGNDADRQALALFLSRMGRENVVPLWRKALPYAGLGALVAAAGAFYLGARARRRRPSAA